MISEATIDTAKELQDVLSDWVFPVTKNFAQAILDFQPSLKAEGDYWGFGDTLLREQALQAMALMLLGMPWPCGKDSGDPRFATFEEDLPKAYDAWVAAHEG